MKTVKIVPILMLASLSGSVVLAGEPPVAKTLSVICANTTPSVEGFELVRVSPKRTFGANTYETVRDNLRYQSSYDRSSERLKIKISTLDADREEVGVIASLDTRVPAGEHMRLSLARPQTEPSLNPELIELVCNIVAH